MCLLLKIPAVRTLSELVSEDSAEHSSKPWREGKSGCQRRGDPRLVQRYDPEGRTEGCVTATMANMRTVSVISNVNFCQVCQKRQGSGANPSTTVP